MSSCSVAYRISFMSTSFPGSLNTRRADPAVEVPQVTIGKLLPAVSRMASIAYPAKGYMIDASGNNRNLKLRVHKGRTSITATVGLGSVYSFPDERHLIGSPFHIAWNVGSNERSGTKGF